MQTHGDIVYRNALSNRTIRFGEPRALKLHDVPKLLADKCAQLLAERDAEIGLNEGLEAHSGVVVKRAPIDWKNLPPLMSIDDYAVLQGYANEISKTASDSSPDWCKW